MNSNPKKRRVKKTLKWTTLSLFVLGIIFIHFYVPRIITEIKNPFTSVKIPSTSFENIGVNGRLIEFTSNDGLKLKGYLTYSDLDSTSGTIILVHGIRGCKEHFIDLSKRLARQGYNSVAIDLRAHGNSEGVHCTFGVKEKYDISSLIDYLNEEENIHDNIGIWGQSLGGAVSLQAMGDDKRIEYGIIESTFSHFRTVTNDYFNYHLGFSFEFFTNYLVNRAGNIAEFNPDEACPLDYCKKIEQPIFMVHGNNDKKIDIAYAKENYSNIKSKKKEFLEIEGGTHLNVWEVGGENYFEKVIGFIESNIEE